MIPPNTKGKDGVHPFVCLLRFFQLLQPFFKARVLVRHFSVVNTSPPCAHGMGTKVDELAYSWTHACSHARHSQCKNVAPSGYSAVRRSIRLSDDSLKRAPGRVLSRRARGGRIVAMYGGHPAAHPNSGLTNKRDYLRWDGVSLFPSFKHQSFL